MKVRFPLYAQTIGFLLIHLILLLVLFLVLFNTKFGPGWDAVLSSPIGDRVEAIGWVIQKQLEVNKRDEWNNVLDEFGKFYGVDFTVFDFTGKQLAGEKIELPESLTKEVIRRRRNMREIEKALRSAQPGKLSPDQAERHIDRGTIKNLRDAAIRRVQGASIEAPRREVEEPSSGAESEPSRGSEGDGRPRGANLEPPHGADGGGPTRGPDGDGPPHGPDAEGPLHGPDADGSLHGPDADGPPPGFDGGPGPDRVQDSESGAPPIRRHFRGRFVLHTTSPDKFWIGIRIVIRGDGRIVPCTLLASADNLWQTGVFFDFKPVLMLVGGVLLISVIFWWPFAYRITRALAEMTKVTEKIAEGRFESRVKVNKWDEIGSMGEAVNQLAARLNTFVSGEKRFLGDIAHELSSPLARLQIGLELLETSANADQESMINDIREEVEEMTHLVNELLAFSKAGLQGKEIELVPINLSTLLTNVTLKTASEQLIKLSVDKDLMVLGDQLLLERAFGNVFRNAVRYASADGDIKVRAQRSGDKISVITADNGPGVPQAALEHLTEPFFRPEPSRSRSSGGVGLGLAIVQTCIESCNGKLSIRNKQPRGLEVEVRLMDAGVQP